MFYTKLRPLINGFSDMLRLLCYFATSLMNLIYWIFRSKLKPCAALKNIHNGALLITCERIENKAYYPAYVLRIEACKEIQD